MREQRKIKNNFFLNNLLIKLFLLFVFAGCSSQQKKVSIFKGFPENFYKTDVIVKEKADGVVKSRYKNLDFMDVNSSANTNSSNDTASSTNAYWSYEEANKSEEWDEYNRKTASKTFTYKPDHVYAILKTSEGTIVVEIFHKNQSLLSVINFFIKLSSNKVKFTEQFKEKYDYFYSEHSRFYLLVKDFFIQGGYPIEQARYISETIKTRIATNNNNKQETLSLLGNSRQSSSSANRNNRSPSSAKDYSDSETATTPPFHLNLFNDNKGTFFINLQEQERGKYDYFTIGKIVHGTDVAKKISRHQTNVLDRPFKKIGFSVKIKDLRIEEVK